jgi:hypothetical protein
MTSAFDAKGYSDWAGSPAVRIVATIPREHFKHIRERAIKKKKSIAAILREYVEVGVEVDLMEDEEVASMSPADRGGT